MTAINHALTGAVIGLVVGEPLIALPAALASHFICDALPHFGSRLPNKLIKTTGFRTYLFIEAGLCFALVALLAIFQPQYWLLAAACAFIATSPDLLWVNKYLKVRRGQHWKRSTFLQFAGGIQWFQRPIGAAVEIAWFAAAVIILAPFLR
ncbi:MAG TPA: hypothetical protein VM535_01650 [Candidatus Saccharimonadales bacterium]|nr:hypothetical protein [Candidatus Saccharimonadales bacterium]